MLRDCIKQSLNAFYIFKQRKENKNMKEFNVFDVLKIVGSGLAFVATVVSVVANKGNEQTLEEKIDARVQAALTEKN